MEKFVLSRKFVLYFFFGMKTESLICWKDDGRGFCPFL